MTISEELARRSITEVLHFTTNRGIVGTLASGALLSRFRLPQEDYLQHVLHVNAANRPEAAAYFDRSQNWLDYVNLSISEINVRYFTVSQRWHEVANIWWGILAFDSVVMTHENVFFATTNNSYEFCARQVGMPGLNSLFVPRINRKGTWFVRRGLRADRLPTCEQAEVLYPSQLSTEFLRRIYVRENEQHDQAKGWLREFGLQHVAVVISPEKFAGQPN